MEILVTVKAYPGIGRTVGEAVCVAGVRLDTEQPEWIRLWPVGFRELPASSRFSKWQIITVDTMRSTRDSRPESYQPNVDSIKLGPKIETKGNWKERKQYLGPLLGQMTLCELYAAQGQAGAPSLGLVKVRPGAVAKVVDGPVWTPEKELQAQILAAPHLFRDQALAPLRPPDFQLEYQWQCMEKNCPGHKHSSCDWEVGGAAITFRKKGKDVRSQLLVSFGEKMLNEAKDTYFFAGNQHQYPSTFLVLGTFYPPIAQV
jgi:hypothetical protein